MGRSGLMFDESDMRWMMPKHHLLHIICLILFVCLICACSVPSRTVTPIVPTTATNFLVAQIPGITRPATTFPCHAGTWDTLEFGVTTEEQLAQWLTKSAFVHHASLNDSWVRESIGAFETHRYIWSVKDEGLYLTSMRLDVISDTLSSLRTPLFYPFTLEEVVAQLGPPESVLLYLNDRHDELAYSYELCYPAQGVVVSGAIYDQAICEQIRQKGQGLLETQWLVTNLTCSVPGTLTEMLGAIYGFSPQATEPMGSLYQPWHGFGEGYTLDP